MPGPAAFRTTRARASKLPPLSASRSVTPAMRAPSLTKPMTRA